MHLCETDILSFTMSSTCFEQTCIFFLVYIILLYYNSRCIKNIKERNLLDKMYSVAEILIFLQVE